MRRGRVNRKGASARRADGSMKALSPHSNVDPDQSSKAENEPRIINDVTCRRPSFEEHPTCENSRGDVCDQPYEADENRPKYSLHKLPHFRLDAHGYD